MRDTISLLSVREIDAVSCAATVSIQKRERERERERESEGPNGQGVGRGPLAHGFRSEGFVYNFSRSGESKRLLVASHLVDLWQNHSGPFPLPWQLPRIHPIGDTKFGIWANRLLWLPTATDKKPANLTYSSRSKRRISHPFVRWSILLSGLGGSLSPSCCPFYYHPRGYCTLLCLLIRGLGLWPTSAPCRMDDMWTGNTFSFYSCPISNHRV